ncbi:NADH dehydrogenase [ubiquinone] 1 beta subcomplex subunit 2, mitochondrial-like [Orussus abietinus]|uniref:NADH dehydrogenase [ubiquinone] 1 beta subcomplex subunit 2, mitochondrial-like n=1 Tax=Orussus abietinus TaxID=222816 RepID=UPI0006256AA8|nr:NADH dehydrogenase [ubiquinone] 1 beta subcomplex subunit 2, mitochondrial-like [Orussus abietinus]XP_012276786.1 NADH dehydrogenase [ubiquinone] 1 beta subcomplex subunit 2, mitochondrial-like [Orussus abietinus]
MLLSRGLSILKSTSRLTNGNRKVLQQIKRNSHEFTYRSIPKYSKDQIIWAEALGGMMYWWIFYNMWHEFGHVVGEFPYPEPSNWTDEELGIPPDDTEF